MQENNEELKQRIRNLIEEIREINNEIELLFQKIPKDFKTLNGCENKKEKYERAIKLWEDQQYLIMKFEKYEKNIEEKNEIIELFNKFSQLFVKDVEFNKLLQELKSEQRSYDIQGIKEIKYDTVAVLTDALGDFLIQEIESQKHNFENQNKELTEQRKKIEDHDKNILNMMGIFLAIFSLIGINISFFTGSLGQNLEICEFLKYLAGVNLILVIAIMTVFEIIKRYTKK